MTTITITTMITATNRTMLIEPFVLMAALAGIGVAVVTGPLGSFVVWRRMAYFGDATAHAAVLGVALAIATDLPVQLGVVLVATAMAATVARLFDRGHAADTSLGVASHGALAIGLVAISMSGAPRRDLMAYLFGDILTTGLDDLAIVWGGALLVLALLIWRWPALLSATFSPEIAKSVGINPARERMILSLCLAVVVAAALKVVGALLIAAMLIIPAAAARPLARTPEGMAIIATAIAAGSVVLGLALSIFLDSPTGPTIVTASICIFALSHLKK